MTGVQTCALPICVVFQVKGPGAGGAQIPTLGQVMNDERLKRRALDVSAVAVAGKRALILHQRAEQPRSEERRVGKECRARGSP